MSSIAIKFSSFTLGPANNVTVGKIEAQETKTVNTYPIPKMDGSVAEQGKRSYITITVEGDVAGSSADNLRTNLDALRAALQNGIQQFTLNDDRYINAQLASFTINYTVMMNLASWSAQFIAHFPYWLASTPSSDTRTPTSGAGYVLTNNGNAPARCRIEVTAPGGGLASVQIQNTTLGLKLVYGGALAGSKVLVIDNRYTNDDFVVTNDVVDDTKNFQGDFLALGAGANTIVYTGSAGASVKITWADTWN